MNDFMKDRYGVDELTGVLGALGLLLALIGTIAKFDPLTWLALASILVALARAFSKNEAARRKENDGFLSLASRVPVLGDYVKSVGASRAGARTSARNAAKTRRNRLQPCQAHRPKDVERAQDLALPQMSHLRSDHLSVPKGKGKIRVTCPRCHSKMETKS